MAASGSGCAPPSWPATVTPADPGELRAFLEAQRIARQKIPEEFLVVDELPRTPAGKVQKFLLVERWEDI